MGTGKKNKQKEGVTQSEIESKHPMIDHLGG